MKRKLSVLLSVLILALALAGCGEQKDTIEYNPLQLEQYAEMVIGTFSQMDDAAIEQFKNGSELQVNLMLMQSGLPVEKEQFVSMMESWRAAIDECGSFVEHGEFHADVDHKGITLTTEAVYEERKAEIAIKFDEKLTMESLDVSAKYSTGEILKKAGLNTVLGMGTVFVVLIFLAFIISLLKYVPVLTDKFYRRGSAPAQAENAAPEENETEAAPEDDLELIAVITAAIAAETGTSSDDFVVRSIRRRPSNHWN